MSYVDTPALREVGPTSPPRLSIVTSFQGEYSMEKGGKEPLTVERLGKNDLGQVIKVNVSTVSHVHSMSSS